MIDRPLPQRWCPDPATARHNAAIIGILDTGPIVPRRDGLVLFAALGCAQVPAWLVAVKSLWRHLGRGRVVILDDGTLAAPDRTILARHCGDPEIMRREDIARGGFPDAVCWDALLATLDRRAGEYWLHVGSDTLTLAPAWDVERAIASNRSMAMKRAPRDPDTPQPLAALARDAGGIEGRLGEMEGAARWRYLRSAPGFRGFAAGNAGRDLAAIVHQQLAALVGPERAAGPECARIAANIVAASEGAPMALPHARYREYDGDTVPEEACILSFAGAAGHANGIHTDLSREVIDELGSRRPLAKPPQ